MWHSKLHRRVDRQAADIEALRNRVIMLENQIKGHKEWHTEEYLAEPTAAEPLPKTTRRATKTRPVKDRPQA